jgi:hypothetical protein
MTQPEVGGERPSEQELENGDSFSSSSSLGKAAAETPPQQVTISRELSESAGQRVSEVDTTNPLQDKSNSEQGLESAGEKISKAETSLPREKTKLPEVTSETLIFSTSSTQIILPSEAPRDARLHAALLFIIVAGCLGIINGLDTIAGDSGLVRDRDFIYSQTQGPSQQQGTAVLDGVLYHENGTSAMNYTIVVDTLIVDQDGRQHMEFLHTATDEEGRFRLEGLNPGLNMLHVRNDSNSGEGMSHRILLSPPALFEPLGFTHLKITYAEPSAFDEAANQSGFRWIDMSESERGQELYDPTAAQVYDIFGTLFAGFGLLGGFIGIIAWRQKSALLMRTAAVLAFFSQGYWYSACCLGLLGLIVTVGLPTDD